MKLVPFSIGEKSGYKCGIEIKIPAIFEYASWFNGEYAIVKIDGKFGIINRKGEFVVPNIYDELSFLFGIYYRFRVNSDETKAMSFGVIDVNKNVIISPKFNKITSTDDNYFLCYEEESCMKEDMIGDDLSEQLTCEKSSKCTWFNLSGKEVTNKEVVNQTKDYLIIKENNVLGVIDSDGNETIAPKYTALEPCFEKFMLATIQTEDEKYYSVVSSDGLTMLKEQATEYCFENGFFYTEIDDEKVWYSYCGIEIYVGDAEPLSTEFLAIPKNGKWGVINANKERVINFLYSQIELLGECFAVLREDKIGLIGLKGEIIVDAVYNKIECVKIENDPFCLGSKEELGIGGIIDSTRYIGYCEEYDFDTEGHVNYRGDKYDSLVRCTIATRHNYRTGKSLSCPRDFDLSKPLILSADEYQEIFSLEEGIVENSRFANIQQITQLCYVVKKNDLYGVFRIDSKSIIIPIEFSRIKFIGGHTALLCKDGLWGATDLIPDSHIFKSLFKVSIECKFYEISILNSDQSLFGVKVPYKNYKDEDDPYYAILNENGEETGEFHSLYIESQFIRYDDRHFLASKQGKFGFVTESAYISIPFIYDEISPRKGGNFNIRIGDGWGIMGLNGKEIVPPKYAQKIPSRIVKPEDVIFEYDDLKDDSSKDAQTNSEGLTLMRDSRSECYGCVDAEGKEVIPTIFEHLMFSENNNILFFGYGGYEDDTSSFFSDVKHANWGCISKAGEVIIDAKYDCFKIVNGFILGGRNGSMLGEGQHGYSYHESEYSGVYDLYDFEGNLLIGGFREFIVLGEKNIFLFKFGGYWEIECEDYDEWGNSIFYYSYHFKKGNSRWLAVDEDFKSISLQKNGEREDFFKHLGTITTKKENGKVTNYWNMPLEVFSINEPYIDKDNLICGDNSTQYSVRISDGIQSCKYKRIEMITHDTLFFSEGNDGVGLVGIARVSNKQSGGDDRIIDPNLDKTWLLTYPVDGFVFGISDNESNRCKVTLYNINNMSFKPIIAISSIEERQLTSLINNGLFCCRKVLSECDTQKLALPNSVFFDKEFLSFIDSKELEEGVQNFDQYWYTDRCLLEESDDDYNYRDYCSYDDHDYMRDTWDAMTDGMYGDMPDGFGGDFDFMGR